MSSNLDKRIAEADAAGMSYGKYVATLPPAEPKKPEGKKPVGVKTCPVCGKEFPVYDKRNHKYCSEECAAEASKNAAKKRNARIAEPAEMAPEKAEPVHIGNGKNQKYKKVISALLLLIDDLIEDDE